MKIRMVGRSQPSASDDSCLVRARRGSRRELSGASDASTSLAMRALTPSYTEHGHSGPSQHSQCDPSPSDSTLTPSAHSSRVPQDRPIWLTRGIRPTIRVKRWEKEQGNSSIDNAGSSHSLEETVVRSNMRTDRRSIKLPLINNRSYAEVGPIVIYVNPLGATCKSPTYKEAVTQLSMYIGSIARLFPLEQYWEDIDPMYLQDLFSDIEDRFEFRRRPPIDAPPCLVTELELIDVIRNVPLHNYLAEIARKAWGDEKNDFVKIVREKSMSLEWARDMLTSDGVPFPYSEEHFCELYTFWRGTEYDALSAAGKHARAHQQTLHSSGSRAISIHCDNIGLPMGNGYAYVSFIAGSTDENVLPANKKTAELVRAFRERLSQPSVSQKSAAEKDLEANRAVSEIFPNPHHHHPIGYGKTYVRKKDLRVVAACDSNPIVQAHLQQELDRQRAEMEEKERQRQAEEANRMELWQKNIMEQVAAAQQKADMVAQEKDAEAARLREEDAREREEEARRIREEVGKMYQEQLAAMRRELAEHKEQVARLVETPRNGSSGHGSTSVEPSTGLAGSVRASHKRKRK